MTDTNSIRMNLTANSIQNEIRLLLNVPKNKFTTIILLEGINDIKIFMPLVNKEKTYLVESFGGKTDIKNILGKFNSDNRVIGIADRDYETTNTPKLFFCDYCNAEMMIISNDNSLKNTLFQISSQWLDVYNIRICVLNKLFYFSIIRKLNEELDWGISFEKVPLHEIIVCHNDLSRIVKLINLKNPNNKIDDDKIALIQREITKLIGKNLLNYTNGHDFCKAMLRELKMLYPNTRSITTLNVDEFFSFIRMGYQKNHFEDSDLYSNLKKYQTEYNLNIV